MRSIRATVTGVFFLVAAAAAIAGLALYQPALSDPAHVLGSGRDGQVLLGGFLEVLLAASCIGTAVTLYPVLRREEESLALGYVCGRLLEAAVIVVGIVATLSLVTLWQSPAEDGLVAVARGLIAVHDWTFLVGPGLVIGVNSVLLATLVTAPGWCRAGSPGWGWWAVRWCSRRPPPCCSACTPRPRRSPAWPRCRSPPGR